MTSMLAILALGFVLGMRHATDADHVLAVATIVSRHRALRHAALIGVCWGLGHTLTIFVVGSGVVLFSWVIPPRLGLSMEFSVGIMLILLGAFTLATTWRQRGVRVHSTHAAPETLLPSTHSHGDYIHTHPPGAEPAAHGHEPDQTPLAWVDRRFGRLSAYQLARPFVVGMVHGLAGSAAVALLVLATITSPGASLLYMLVFGAGTVAGMMLITAAIALPFALSSRSLPGLTRGLAAASGIAALGFGIVIAYQIGFVEGLFGR